MPTTAKEPAHAKDECLGAGIDIGDSGTVQQSRRLTTIIEREGDGYVALVRGVRHCQLGRHPGGQPRKSYRATLLLFETANRSEIDQRLHSDVFVTQVEVPVG